MIIKCQVLVSSLLLNIPKAKKMKVILVVRQISLLINVCDNTLSNNMKKIIQLIYLLFIASSIS